MVFKGLKATYSNSNDTFFIIPCGNEFKLYVEPKNRFNGTENFDGRYPRFYSHPRYAKAGLTKFLGKPEKWQEITD